MNDTIKGWKVAGTGLYVEGQSTFVYWPIVMVLAGTAGVFLGADGYAKRPALSDFLATAMSITEASEQAVAAFDIGTHNKCVAIMEGISAGSWSRWEAQSAANNLTAWCKARVSEPDRVKITVLPVYRSSLIG